MATKTNVIDDLLKEDSTGSTQQSTPAFSVADKQQFAGELVNNILNYWANGNPVVELRVALGTEDEIKQIMEDPDTAELAGPYSQAYRELIKVIKVSGTAEPLPKPVVLISQRDLLGFNEPASVLQWAFDIGLADRLAKRGLVMVPTTNELRIAAIVAAVLEIEEEARRTKAVVLPQPGDPRRISIK